MQYGLDVLRDIETRLSEPLFRGVPLGPTLTDVCNIDLRNGRGDWSRATRWKNHLRRIKYYWFRGGDRNTVPKVSPGRILVTLIGDNFRVTELICPVVRALDPARCVVLAGNARALRYVPEGAETITWDQALQFDAAQWRRDYRRCRPAWHRRLRQLCRQHRLPPGAYELLALRVLLGSRAMAGCLQFLETARPAAVLTEYDRNSRWSCLVLAARAMGIPTFTMVHGVLNESAMGYVPVLADKVLCWGEMQRRQFLRAGEPADKLLVAGCPRLTRELPSTSAAAKTKLGVAADKPLVMLGTMPVAVHLCQMMAELFCRAVEKIGGVSAVVRLHPSESLETYEPVARLHPNVRFLENSAATLDEALAAADLVVVSGSGLGSDALAKRRLAIVLELPDHPLGHGADLIEQAGCPRAANVDELAAAIRSLLEDETRREEHLAAAERYVADFCAFFGQDSARCIAEAVHNIVAHSTHFHASARPS